MNTSVEHVEHTENRQIDRILTVAEVAKLLRCQSCTIFRLRKSGRLRGIQLGSAVRFRQSDVERFLDEGGARLGD